MAPPLLTLQGIRLSFGGTPLIEGADLTVARGDRICLVGRNGSGKSTLLKIAAGLIDPDDGERFLHPRATLRYLPQEPDLSGYETTLAYVEAGLAPGDDAFQARFLLESLGLTGAEAPASLSGGEARRAALARVLAAEPDILLLDEPTNHLDLPAIEWLEGQIATLPSAIVLISHDRRFLEDLSKSTVWLDRGRTRRIDQGFGMFEEWRDKIYAEEDADRQKLDRKIAMEEDWVRYGVTARRKRNVRRMAELQDLRQKRASERRVQGTVRLEASEGTVSGKIVIEATDVSKAYDGTAIVDRFSTRVARGDRVALVGPNGAGKTTLLSLLTGVLEPDSGRVKLGANLQMVTLDQRRESLDPAWTLTEALTGGRGDHVIVGGESRHVVSYMKDFLFSPEQARTSISVLSGGERGRLMLARALAKPSNLLVLDEPTNDLDLETLDLLEELLADYAGTILLVSHDRDFLDRVATSTVMSEGAGRWVEYAGGYSDMVAQRGAGVAAKVKAKPAGTEPVPDAPVPAKAAAQPKKKLSFKEKHALETLPAKIADLDAKAAKLQAELDDPKLFSRDRARFDRLTHELAALRTAHEAAEEEWLRLAMLAEELG